MTPTVAMVTQAVTTCMNMNLKHTNVDYNSQELVDRRVFLQSGIRN